MARRTTQSAANQCVVMRIGGSATHRSSLAKGSKYPPPRNAHHVSPRAYPATGTRSHALQRSLAWPVRLSRLLDQSRLVSSRPAASNTANRLYYSVSHTIYCFFFAPSSPCPLPKQVGTTYRTVPYFPELPAFSARPTLSHACFCHSRSPTNTTTVCECAQHSARITRRPYASCVPAQLIWQIEMMAPRS